MWHKPCRTFHPWCPCIKTRCLYVLPAEVYPINYKHPRWRHQMETYSVLLAICAGNSPVTDELPAQRPLTRSFHVFFALRVDKRLSKQSWGWFETPSRPLWRHCNYLLCFVLLAIQGSNETHLDDLVQDCSNSIANALVLPQSCTKLSIWYDIILRTALTCHAEYLIEYLFIQRNVSWINHNLR